MIAGNRNAGNPTVVLAVLVVMIVITVFRGPSEEIGTFATATAIGFLANEDWSHAGQAVAHRSGPSLASDWN